VTAQQFAFPTSADVLEIHRRALARSGGAPGIRDPEGVEAALARPEQLVAYSDQALSIFSVGAALAASFCRIRHPFVDGNKRVAFGAVSWFMWLNGWRIDATERDVVSAVRGLSTGDLAEEQFAAWLEQTSWRR
jgi:death-on-curing protein